MSGLYSTPPIAPGRARAGGNPSGPPTTCRCCAEKFTVAGKSTDPSGLRLTFWTAPLPRAIARFSLVLRPLWWARAAVVRVGDAVVDLLPAARAHAQRQRHGEVRILVRARDERCESRRAAGRGCRGPGEEGRRRRQAGEQPAGEARGACIGHWPVPSVAAAELGPRAGVVPSQSRRRACRYA